MDVALQGEQARLTLDALSLGGGFLNGYRVEASIVAPDGEAQSSRCAKARRDVTRPISPPRSRACT